jgi:galactokinase
MTTGSPHDAAKSSSSHLSAHIVVSTPGRVCLFGEHQDYLHLPVVPCAISLRIAITAEPIADRKVVLNLPDIQAHETFSLDGELPYRTTRDYFRSAVNVLRREGFTFGHGIRGTVHGTIPINSGTSSSSALVVTWIDVLARLSDQGKVLSPSRLASLSHEAEVVEFGEPGGMMDHYSTAYGGVLALDFHPKLHVEPIKASLGTFVLGDSGEPKDTQAILARVKFGVLNTVRKLAEIHPGFSLQKASHNDIDHLADRLTAMERELLHGTLDNRDLTRAARQLLGRDPLDHRQLGALLNEHQKVLREVQKISTPKIDRMLNAALEAGAYGGKINGSGGGGCMFAYAPEHPRKVAEAIEKAGGRAYIVTPDEGTCLEPNESVQ